MLVQWLDPNTTKQDKNRQSQISLREARVFSGYTAKEVSLFLGISPKTLSKYEYNAGDMPLHIAFMLLQLFHLPFERIYFGRQACANIMSGRI